MVAASPQVQIIEQVSAFLICDATLEDASRAAVVQLPVVTNDHKGFGPASDPSSLGLIRGEVPSDEAVEVQNALVRLEVRWWGQAFHLHGFSPGRGGFCLRWGGRVTSCRPLRLAQGRRMAAGDLLRKRLVEP
jgi:hypothetical protein